MNRPFTKQAHPVTNSIQVSNNKCHPTRSVILKQAHISRDRCSKCGISKHVEGFKCHAKKYQCKSFHKYGHFTSLCCKKQVSFKPRYHKAYQLQAEEVYPQEDSICIQSKDLTSSDESL